MCLTIFFLSRSLSMSHNQLTELPQRLTSLRRLDFSVNLVGVVRASDMADMAQLTHLNISSNEISRFAYVSFIIKKISLFFFSYMSIYNL